MKKKKKINKRLLYALKIVQRNKVILAEKQLEDLKHIFIKSRRLGASNWQFKYTMKIIILERKYIDFINKWKIK